MFIQAIPSTPSSK